MSDIAGGFTYASQQFTDRFSTYYTYLVLGLSLAMFFVWWLAFQLPAFTSTAELRSAFYRTMTLLVALESGETGEILLASARMLAHAGGWQVRVVPNKFPALRIEGELERRGVRWIDDSKGTNVGATLAAVAGLPGPLVVIAGGDGIGEVYEKGKLVGTATITATFCAALPLRACSESTFAR